MYRNKNIIILQKVIDKYKIFWYSIYRLKQTHEIGGATWKKELLNIKIKWYGSAKHYVYHKENPLYTEHIKLYDTEIETYVSLKQDGTKLIPCITILDE